VNRGRAETDESLKTERSDADQSLQQVRAAERAADQVVDSARDEADALRQAESIAKAIEGKIPSEAALFADR